MSDDDMFLSSPTPSPKSVGYQSSFSPSLYTPSAPTDYESPHPSGKTGNTSPTQGLSLIDLKENVVAPNKVTQVRIEFLDETGNNVAQTRYSDDQEIVNILCSLVRSNDQQFMKSTVQKMCNSNLFQTELQNNILHKLSKDFSKFLSSELCPLKNDKIFNSVKDFSELNLNEILSEI